MDGKRPSTAADPPPYAPSPQMMAQFLPGNNPNIYERHPANIQCQFCHQYVSTRLDCLCLPFCGDCLKNVHHRCPNCRNIVGKSSIFYIF